MREIELKRGTKLKLYDDIDNLPVENYLKMKELWHIESQLGSSPADIVGKYSKLNGFIKNDLKDHALKEINLIITSHVNQINKVDHTSLSFICSIHSINDKLIDFTKSNEELKKTLNKLSKNGLTYKMVEFEINDLKKKLIPNFN